MKCSRRTRRASGPPTSTRPAADRNRTTSSTFAITWKKFTGTSSRLRRRLPDEVARRTSEKYLDAYFQITGHKLDV